MPKLKPDLPKKTFWHENEGQIEIGTLLTLRRNLDRFLFPSKLDKEKRSQILSLLSQQLMKGETTDRFYKGEDCSPLDKEWFQEHYFLCSPLQEIHRGEGFILNHTGNFGAFFNIGDHLQLRFLGGKEQLEEGWRLLSQKDDELQETSAFAFSPHFGFLTSMPKDAGTGLEVEILLQVPALSLFREEEHLLLKEEDRIEALPLFSDTPGIDRGLLLIKNRTSLGMSEDQILSLLRNFAEKVINKEEALRKRLLEKEESSTKDRISRAYGLLVHSYQIETLEAIEAFGWIKMGLEFGWIKGVEKKKLNSLLVDVRRGHLTERIEKDVPREELLHLRAEFLHQQLKGIELLI